MSLSLFLYTVPSSVGFHKRTIWMHIS
jgi:hypothetical protein